MAELDSDFTLKLNEFLDHFMSLAEDNEENDATFNKEFQALKMESQRYKDQNTFPAESGQNPVNKKKNRFKDILPFEYTRVQLHKIEGVEGSDYINANYIQGPDGNVEYIAAQGPLPHTVNDFWRMIWYHQIEIVIMACREVEMAKPKCQCYWPQVGESAMYGAIQVTTDHEENVSNDFIIRQLTAECQGEKQVIRQFHYTAWPDHGRPESATPIIRMIEMFREHRKRHDIPFAIHCSAGCGRTGTIIAIDFARTMLIKKTIPDKLDVFSIVQQMRKQRPAMVQALDQYVFVYMAIVELVQQSLTNVPQLPPRMLNFEKAPVESPVPTNTDDAVYQNITSLNNEGSSESDHPVPMARTFSGSTTSGSDGNRPHPPPKPTKPKPEIPKKPLSEQTSGGLKKPPPMIPRKGSKPEELSHPVPAPRKPSPVPPTDDPQVPQAPTALPRTSTPSKPLHSTPSSVSSVSNTPDKSVSKSSILETLINEVGLQPDDLVEVSRDESKPGGDYTYASLGATDVPPAIPERTSEALEVMNVPPPLYESAELPPPLPPVPMNRTSSPSSLLPSSHHHISPTSSSTAFSVATMRNTDLTNKPKKERFSDDTSIPSSSKSSSVSPRKAPRSNIAESANNKYSFSGNYGFGVRVGKPKGPRPPPQQWTAVNGIIH
ncbi:PREDICTED: tyrosine-protein phosphatase non-receptor type 12-like [Amphimedon queenslandica]|uniref:protein-tyrosine-phosphatase n=3 Tax=Amphimedon queenslandica TaxID=400682 RepID=A0A1X7VRF9_AMPQE|nr:PREDICTED: tyrosine-protein phosphatase non-receptor type 12-like [Amphimedon queenslandica]|eukprot:XP_003383058.2 PREDICTED: tyrosine-protein phosphatase non-receptor type 12-like [Amphimedon queenslandica]